VASTITQVRRQLVDEIVEIIDDGLFTTQARPVHFGDKSKEKLRQRLNALCEAITIEAKEEGA